MQVLSLSVKMALSLGVMFMKKNPKLTAIDIANYFLVLVDREAGDVITHLKLLRLQEGVRIFC